MSVLLPTNPTKLSDSDLNINNLSVDDSGVIITDDNSANTNIKLVTNNKVGLYVSDTQRIGININSIPEKRLVINDEIGECIRLIYNKESDNIGKFNDINITEDGSLNIQLYNNQFLNIINQDNTPNLKLNNQIVYATADQLNYNYINNIGYAEAGKSLVVDDNLNILGINKIETNELKLNSSLQLNMDSINYALDIYNQTGKCLKLQRDNNYGLFQITDYGTLSIYNNNNIIEFLGNNNNDSIFPVHLTTEGNQNNSGVGIKFNTYNNNNIKRNISSIETIIINNQNNNEDSIIKFHNMNSGILENTVTIRNDGYILCQSLMELSDIRTKNILNNSKFEDSLNKICDINIYDFTYKKDDKKIIHKGLMAQELRKIIPSAVNINESDDFDDLHTISNKEIIGYLIDCIKALKYEINKLKKK